MDKSRLFAFFFIFLLSFSIVSAINSDMSSEVDQIESVLDKVDDIYDVDNQEFNPDTIEFGKSAANERINIINDWLDENASWLRFILRMTPQLSWLFFINFYFFLWFVVYVFWESPKYVEIFNDNQNKWLTRFIGLIVMSAFLALNATVIISNGVLAFISVLNNVIGKTIIAVLIGFVLFIVLSIIAPTLVIKIIKTIRKVKQVKGVVKSGVAGSKEINNSLNEVEKIKEEFNHQLDIAKGRNQGFDK